MALIGDLVANMKVNSSAWSSGLNRSRGKLDKFEKSTSSSMSRMSAGFAKLAAVAGAAFASAKLVSGINQSMQAIDKLAKTSDKLGLTTEALAGLRHAAELTGAGTKTLDMGLQRMTRRIADASMGTGEAVKALNELGLSAERLNAMSPDEQFRQIAGAMANVDGQSNKVRLAFKLFDSEGVNLVNTLALGADGLQDVQDEAERLGLAINRVDAAKIEMANDAITKMQAAFGGVVNTLAIKLSPVILSVTNQFTEMGVSATNSTNQIGGSWRGLMRAIAFGADILGSFRLLWDQMAITATQGIGDILRDMKSLGDTIASVVNMIPGMSVKVPKSLDITIAAMDAMQSKMQRDLDNKMLGPSAGEKMMKDFDEAIEQAKRMQDQIAKPVQMPVMPMLNYAELSDGLSRFFSPIGDAISRMFAGNDSGRSDNGDRAARLANTQEFFSTLYAAQRGSQADPQTKIQEHTKMAADILETASSTLQSIDQYLRDLTIAEAT
jgi:hypothetical protein